jgi:hypothetical protein
MGGPQRGGRRWLTQEGIYICHGCIGDEYLKAEVRHEGRRRACEFCGKLRKAWPLDELAARVQDVVVEHFRITPSDPRDEVYAYDKDSAWERRGDPVADVIAELAGLEPEPAEAVRARISEKTGYDAFDGGYEDPFGSDTYYEEGRPDTFGFRESWQFFREEIRTRSRFFGRAAQQALDEIFGDLASLKTWEGIPAIKEISPGDEKRFLHRARIAYSEGELRNILAAPVRELGPPSARLARAGRMNAAGISVFYGAIEADTCIAEARAPVGSHVVLGRFEIIRPVRVLDMDVLTKVVTDGSWFDPVFSTRSNRAAFLRHLVEEIARPVMPRDEESEYLPTQAVAEYLASCVEPRLDGIISTRRRQRARDETLCCFTTPRRSSRTTCLRVPRSGSTAAGRRKTTTTIASSSGKPCPRPILPQRKSPMTTSSAWHRSSRARPVKSPNRPR